MGLLRSPFCLNLRKRQPVQWVVWWEVTAGPDGSHFCHSFGGMSGEKGRWGRTGASIMITLTATPRSTLLGLHQPQRLKHFSLLGEKLGQRLPISDGQFYLFKEEVYYSQFLKNIFWYLFCIPWVISTIISCLYHYYLLSPALLLIARQISKALPSFS